MGVARGARAPSVRPEASLRDRWEPWPLPHRWQFILFHSFIQNIFILLRDETAGCLLRLQVSFEDSVYISYVILYIKCILLFHKSNNNDLSYRKL